MVDERTSAQGGGLSARWVPALAAVLAIVFFAAWSIRQEYRFERAQAISRLESITELRVTQVQQWLDRQMSLAYYLDDSVAIANMFVDWRDKGDKAQGELLMSRMIDFRKANEADVALLLDSSASVLASENPVHNPVAPQLKAAVDEAIAVGHSVNTSIYRRDHSPIPLRLDVVIPLLKTVPPSRGLAVVRIDPRRKLYPMLETWPVPTTTGESVLWERRGEEVVNLSNTRDGGQNALALSEPVATSGWAVSTVLRGDELAERAVDIVDWRGHRVLSVVRPVEGTNWWLSSKIDIDEVYAPARRNARWTIAVALMALLAIPLIMRLLRQRQDIVLGSRERVEQRRRIQNLGLLEGIAQSGSDLIFAKDLEGRYVFCNRAAGEALQMAPEDIIGKSNRDLFDAETAATLDGHDAEVLANMKAEVFEERLPTPAGEVTLLCTKGPLRDAQGQLIGTFGVSRDIREMRRAERALRDSEARYRSVVAVLSEAILVCDADGALIASNPAADRIFGSAKPQWKDRERRSAVWTPHRPDGSIMPVEETPTGIVLAGGPAQHEVLLTSVSPSGLSRVFSVSAAAVTDAETGELTAVVTSVIDVTDRQRMEADLERHRSDLEQLVAERTQALTVANERLQSMLRFNTALTDTLPGMVVYWDASYRCRFANRSYLEWVGKSAEDVLDHSVQETHGRDYEERVKPHLEAALAGEVLHFERSAVRPDGREFYFQTHYIPDRSETGEINGAYVMAFDITELKQAEASLQRLNEELARSRDEAQSATRAKSAFLANMSHEIRTPMNAIIGLTHLMTRDSRDALQHERLGKVSNAAQHLLQVINDILDLSKIEAGKLTLEDAEFSPETVLSRVVEMVATKVRDKGLELILDTDRLQSRLRGDATRLSQILLNLLSNAVKFTDHGWVRLRADTVEETSERITVRFEVQDTGPGISQERQAALFSTFEQADKSLTRRFGGTGLGLALSRQLARAMGGDAGVDSELGQGSTFWFTAVFGRGAEAMAKRPDVVTTGLRALVVDDLPEALSVVGERLQAIGVEVTPADTGGLAVRLVEQQMQAARPFDVILVDWRMEPMDGIETLRHLRALLAEGTPPCVLITAFDDPMVYEQAAEVGYDAVMLKPITSSTLNDTLNNVLARHSKNGGLYVAESGSPSETLLRSRHAGQRILLAEDNPVNREVAEELLRSAGLVVETAWDGARAVEMALSRPYDLVLMDIQMPVMDGLEATRAIRQRAGRSMPIVAMTANAFTEDREVCLAAGMNDHVPKPVDPTTMYDALLRWLPLRGAAPAPVATLEAQAAEGRASTLRERLERIDGLDVSAALRLVGGQVAVLGRILQRFVDSYRPGLPGLLDLSGDEESGVLKWRAACHSVRGALSTLGVTLLVAEIQSLERDLTAREGEPVTRAAFAERARAVHEELQRLVDQIDQALKG